MYQIRILIIIGVNQRDVHLDRNIMFMGVIVKEINILIELKKYVHKVRL